MDAGRLGEADACEKPAVDLSTARIEVETVQQRQVLVNGVPESGTFE